ncbi:MAG: ABC transporter ATP-binding protein [Deltaproteobacteria bacterium HGW-Deltaproteobacteria-2]|jgi:ATP-binding cassette subfamily F protein uup|nr:MAG: ABC transporter ATP-binding protein [Deltaproteobacteria bacterium HGW-Deltaproteobacteria-2]
MAVLLNLDKISKSFGTKALFTDLCLTVNEGERIGIIGDNGTGKTTLTKIMVNLESTDAGNIAIRKNLKTAYIPQVSNYEAFATVWDIVASRAATDFKNADVKTAKALSIVGFNDHAVKVNTLSGGWTKRLDIACGIVNEPELLILDEPTNHLDYQALAWLENFLGSARFTWVMVSHDRFLLERCANRIVEISKRYEGNIFYSDGRYDDFLEKRLLYIEQQNKLEAVMSNKVRAEIEWLRRGPKARRTKAKYRIDEAHNLIKELADLKEKKQTSRTEIEFSASNRKTKVLVKIKNISKSFGDKHILKNFTVNLTTGLRIGLLGGNGVGKTTLLTLLSKQIEPDAGSVEHADNLKIVYFDQLRESLHQQKTIKQFLADGNDTVIFKDRPVHLVSWIKRFGFATEQINSTIASLSGGEQARILIAKLMLQPADILLLDEPTNDLDIRTIETLEENLLEFGGLLVIVSHDRYMISRVCSLFIGFTTDAKAELFADYEQWEESLKTSKKENTGDARKTDKDKGPKKEKTKLSYKEKLELQDVEKQIEILHDKIKLLEAQLADPKNFSDYILLHKLTEEIAADKDALDKFYHRWEYLTERTM